MIEPSNLIFLIPRVKLNKKLALNQCLSKTIAHKIISQDRLSKAGTQFCSSITGFSRSTRSNIFTWLDPLEA